MANDGIDLDIVPGEIHCLLGENGAGKSTLMNVLYGLFPPDEGKVIIDGVEHVSRNSKEAIAAGIGMVHQHFMLVEVFTVAENLILGRESGRAGLLDMRQARRTVRELSERYRLEVDPDALVEDLPVGVQQRVEILKALANDAKYLIFDEPTAVLTPQEIDELIEVMRSLRDEGRAIVFITHKLREVRAIADKITVIRRGKVVGQAQPTDSEAQLAELMVGRAVSLRVDKTPAQSTGAAPRLVLENVSVAAPNGTLVVDDLDLEVAGGEIVCIAGVQGNGQTELAEALLGITPTVRGRGPVGRPAADRTESEADHRCRPGVRPRGPQARRVRRLLHGGREPGAEPVRRAAVRPRGRPEPGQDHRQRRASDGGVRHPGPVDRDPRVLPVRRQSAEGGAGPGAVAPAVAP